MITSPFIRTHRLLRGTASAVSVSVAACLLAGSLQARPVPANLGNGLDKLVESHLAIAQASASGAKLANAVTLNGTQYTDETTAAVAANSLSDAQGRLLVRVTLDRSRSQPWINPTVASA